MRNNQRFYDIFRCHAPLQVDGLHILDFGGAAQDRLWRLSFQFACSLTHCLGDRAGILQLCTSSGDRAEFQISMLSGFESANMFHVPSEALRCMADACFYSGFMAASPEICVITNLSSCKYLIPHDCLYPQDSLSLLTSFNGEVSLRGDLSELLAQRDSLRGHLSSNKISTSPWSRLIKIRENVDCCRYSLVTPLVFSLAHNNLREAHRKPPLQRYLEYQERRCKLVEIHARNKESAPGSHMGLNECQKRVEACQSFTLKRKHIGLCAESRKRQQSHSSQLGTSSQRSFNRQLRDSGREGDRLGRLLRRATELDVSRCCNDLRTLLLARGQCEEAELQASIPPSNNGQFQASSHSSSSKIADEQRVNCDLESWPMPLIPSFFDQGISGDAVLSAFRIAEFCAFPLQTAQFPRTQMFPPSGLELMISLRTASCGLLNFNNDGTLHRVATMLVQLMMPALSHVLGIVNLTHRMAGLISANHLIWPSFARLWLLMCSYRELGLTNADTITEIWGDESWSNDPDPNSADSGSMQLFRGCLTMDPRCKTKQAASFFDYRVSIPAPDRKAVVPINDEPNYGIRRCLRKHRKKVAACRTREIESRASIDSGLAWHEADPLGNILQSFMSISFTKKIFRGAIGALLIAELCSLYAFLNALESALSVAREHTLLVAFKSSIDEYSPFRGFTVSNCTKILPSCLLPDHQERDFYSSAYLLSDVCVSRERVKNCCAACRTLRSSKVARRIVSKMGKKTEFDTLIHAIAALSQGMLLPSKNTWSNVLTALVNSTAFSDIQAHQRANDQKSEERILRLCKQNRAINIDRGKYVANGVILQGPFETQFNTDCRKQREAHLVSDVISKASRTLQKQYNVASRKFLLTKGGSDQASGIEFAGDAVTDRSVCVLCGGGHDYLASPIKSFSGNTGENRASMGPGFDEPIMEVFEQGGNYAAAHEFCIEAVTAALAMATNKMRQQKTSSSNGASTSIAGRTFPLGTDQAGRIYWHFTSSPTYLHVQIPFTCLQIRDGPAEINVVRAETPATKYQRQSNHVWISYNTLPVIKQITDHLEKRRTCRVSNLYLSNRIHGAFPSIGALSEGLRLGTHSKDITQTEIESAPDENCLTNIHIQQRALYEINDSVLMRKLGMLWPATVISTGICSQGCRLYELNPCGRGACVSCWVRAENILAATTVSSAVQKYLYRSRMLLYQTLCIGCAWHLSNLIASRFVGMPSRMALSPAVDFRNTAAMSGLAQVRIATLIVEAALPLGAKLNWTNSDFKQRSQRLENVVTSLQLIELIIMLEDELDATYLHMHWRRIRRCLPSRTHLLRHPCCSWAAVLICLLDSAIIYDKTRRSPSPVSTA